MRFIPALLGALLITVLVFLFMQGLIKGSQRDDMQLLVHSNVEILRTKPEQEEPEPEEEIPEEPLEQPVMESLEVAPLKPEAVTKPEAFAELEMSALDLAVGDIKIRNSGDRWSAPLGTGTVDMIGGGENAQGFIEVIPYNTRRPNVPEAAWQNKINGWVLVAFRVTPQGGTRDIRVLDARPRGVFEEMVIAAVSDWQYKVNFYGEATGNIVLTQKVEVLWENYPQNLPNVD